MPPKSISPELLAGLEGCHPFVAAILGVALNHDKFLSISRKNLLLYIAGQIGIGQREISHDQAAKACKMATENARKGLQALTDVYLEAERSPGPGATRWRVRMPPCVDVPLAERKAAPQLSNEPAPFDADRHRAIGAKFGFDPRATDLLIEFRQNLALPRNRA